MARLSARGRKELVRVVREREVTDSTLINWDRRTRTLMSDGTILEKVDVRFLPSALEPNGQKHSYGWKVYGKAKKGLTAEQFVSIYVERGGWRQEV